MALQVALPHKFPVMLLERVAIGARTLGHLAHRDAAVLAGVFDDVCAHICLSRLVSGGKFKVTKTAADVPAAQPEPEPEPEA